VRPSNAIADDWTIEPGGDNPLYRVIGSPSR
jgi:hypothetical protein